MLTDSRIDIRTHRQSGSGPRGEEKGQATLFDHLKALCEERHSRSDQSDQDESKSVVECSRPPIRSCGKARTGGDGGRIRSLAGKEAAHPSIDPSRGTSERTALESHD